MAAGRIAMVTGAGSGIGKASALALARAGYAVVLAGRQGGAPSRWLPAKSAGGGVALAVPTDVGDPDSVAALFARTKETYGRLDVLFNNAGVSAPDVPLEDSASPTGRGWWRPISPACSCARKPPSAS